MGTLRILAVLSVVLCALMVHAGELHDELERIIGDKDTKVGVAVIMDGDTVVAGDECHYPMMSVVKFHQALAVAAYMDKNEIPLDDKIHVLKRDLLPNTWSPLRDRFPDGNIDIKVSELLEYTLQWSDNNACDILFRYVGGTAVVDSYIRSLGIEDFCISATEDDMHRNVEKCHENWTSPLAAAELVEMFYSKDLFGKSYKNFIYRTMVDCETGKDRLVAPLQGTKDVVAGHKTGTGDRDSEGRQVGCNDIGFVVLPDGRHYSIAVFITDSAESDASNSRIIAKISKATYDYMRSK